MLENKFKTGLVRELKERFPGCMVVHLDPNEIQGIPDLLVLYGTTWGGRQEISNCISSSEPELLRSADGRDEFCGLYLSRKQGGSS